MAVSGADRQNPAGGHPAAGTDLSEFGRPGRSGSSQTFGSDSPTLSHSLRLAGPTLADDTDNSDVQVLDDPVEPGDSADSEPPAIEVFSGSAAVADGSSETFQEHRQPTEYLGGNRNYLCSSIKRSDAHRCTVIVE